MFISSLTTLETNASFPEIEEFSLNTNTINFTRDDYTVNPVNFKIVAFYGNQTNNFILKENLTTNQEFLYYDESDIKYSLSSYPVKVNIAIDLYDFDDFTNEQETIDIDQLEEFRADALSNSSENYANTFLYQNISGSGANPDKSIYRYQVISWGDEKISLTDDNILNSYHFSMYDSEQWPSIETYEYRKGKEDQIKKSKPIIETNENNQLVYNLSSHVYSTPGPKSIKIIIYRYTLDSIALIESTLITKNININDGLLLSQDFSIFGGTDFKFLPLDDSSAIIGGIDEDSNYNNSVEKIKKDDNFIKEDYLEKQSAKNFVDNFNSELFGESLNQLDLSLTRVFTKPIDLYYFIGAGNSDKRKEIRQNNFELNDINLPINSSATDIFIDDEDCIIDINPNEIEFGTLPNKKISSNKAILIGDYKLDQPKESRITKQGVMQIPLIENDSDKQAF